MEQAKEHELMKIETDLFLEAIFRRFGYDFRGYSRASINRRIRQAMALAGCDTITALTNKVLHEENYLSSLLRSFSITVTEMFRDPEFYVSLRNMVVPFLKTFPYLKVWHAGCASGEEVYSLAILLQEEGLYDRCTIYATDFNDYALDTARAGIYPLENLRGYTRNYQAASGRDEFSDYYHAQYDSAIMSDSLKKNITFANHNLAIDSVFSEVHLILCRNVMIYFDKELKERVYRLFADSLVYNGFLCLGSKEGMEFSNVMPEFVVADERNRIYQYKVRSP